MSNTLVPLKKNINYNIAGYNYLQPKASFNSLISKSSKVTEIEEPLFTSFISEVKDENENKDIDLEEEESGMTPNLPFGSDYAYGDMGYMSALCNIGSLKQLQYASKY